MGEAMAVHVLKSKRFDAVWIFDINKAATKGIAKQGAKVAKSLQE